MSTKLDIWRKIGEVFLYGIAGYFALFVTNIARAQGHLSLLDVVTPITGFFLLAYWRATRIEKCYEVIDRIILHRWRKAVRAFRFWVFVFAGCVISAMITGILFSISLNIIWGIIFVVSGLLVVSLLLSLSVFSLLVYIPSSQYLSSTQIEIEKKKKVADALTLLTPMLGFPLLISEFLALILMSIQIEPYWVTYVMFISTYVILYFLFVDLPYSVSMRERKRMELDRLANERNETLRKLGKTNDDEKSLLAKVVLELEVARIDREEKEIKSESVHPYKIIIPLASFFFGIFGALLLEFVKSLLGV
jgi:uncharacterized protein YacL